MHDHMKALAQFFSESPVLQSTVMSMVITFLRIAYDSKEEPWQRTALEMSLAGCLSITAGSLLAFFGAPQETLLGVGGAVGFIGVKKIRQIALRYLTTKAEGQVPTE